MPIQQLKVLYQQLNTLDLHIIQDLQDLKMGLLESSLSKREKILDQIRGHLEDEALLTALAKHTEDHLELSQQNLNAKNRQKRIRELLIVASKINHDYQGKTRSVASPGLTISKFNISI